MTNINRKWFFYFSWFATSSFDRIRQQAGSFLSRTSAVVRGSSDVESSMSSSVSAPYRRASSSECQSTWTEKDLKLTAGSDPYHRRSNSGEVYTKDSQPLPQCGRNVNLDNTPAMCGGNSVRQYTEMPTSPGVSSLGDSKRDETSFTSFAAATGSKFVGPETVLATTTMTTPSMTAQSPRYETRDACRELQPGCHQPSATETARGSSLRQERSVYGTKPGSSSVQASSSVHPIRVHAKQPHFVAGETAASNPDFRRGNIKTASKRRRDYRSKKQVQEVHHSGSLTETSQHPPAPMPPVHGYSEVLGEPSSSDNSLEQPSTT